MGCDTASKLQHLDRTDGGVERISAQSEKPAGLNSARPAGQGQSEVEGDQAALREQRRQGLSSASGGSRRRDRRGILKALWLA